MALDLSFWKKILKPKTTDISFDKVVSTGKATLENQDGRIYGFGHLEIIEYIQKIIDDTQQFITLELPEANYGIRYVQASVNYGKICVQLGLEDGANTKLVEKICSQEECQRIFLDFFDYGYVNEVEKYKPVQFFV